jgi:hypothetical protein
MVLIRNALTVNPENIGREWLNTYANSVNLALALIPFAGIAFFWFTGVIRDHIGEREDRFFATVFLGSGIAFVVLLFVYAATIGAIFGSYALAPDIIVNDDIFIFGFAFMNEIIGNYALRIAGVYMISIGTLWTRTGTMPRWLTMITYILAIGFLFFANSIRDVRFVFPSWVMMVSIYVLILNRRMSK